MPSGCPSSSLTYTSGTCSPTPGGSDWSSPAPSGTAISSYAVAGSSPSGSDTSTASSKTIRMAFWGDGTFAARQSTDPLWFGNRWFRENILQPLDAAVGFNIDQYAFAHNDGVKALRKLLAEIDQNGDHIISSSEASHVTIKICGFSWGAVTALGIAQKLNQTGYLRVGGSPSQPIQYRLDATVPVNTLIMMDAVDILNWPTGSVPASVTTFRNYYQTRQNNSQFTSPSSPYCPAGVDSNGYNWGNFGFKFTRRFRGVTVSGAPANSERNVNTYCTDCFKSWNIPNLGGSAYRLYGPKVNHTTLPLYVSDLVLDLMK